MKAHQQLLPLIYLSLSLTLLCTSVTAQRVNFDKLKQSVLNAQSNKEKAEAIMRLAAATGPKESHLTFQYADTLLAMAEDEHEDFYHFAAKYIQAVALYRTGKLKEAKGKFISCERYFKNNNQENAFRSKNFVGIIYSRLNQSDSAILVFEEIISSTPAKDSRGLMSAYGNLGNAYKNVGNYGKAIDSFEKAISYAPENHTMVISSYMNIATMFDKMELYEEGIKTMQKAAINKLPNNPVKASYFNNIGELYNKNGQPDSAIYFLRKGIASAESMRQQHLAVRNRLLLSDIYLAKGRPDSSLVYIKAAKMIISGQPRLQPNFLLDLNQKLANYYSHKGQYDSVIFYGMEMIKITKEHRFKLRKDKIYQLLAEAYEHNGEITKSNEYYSLYAAIQDSIKASKTEKFLAETKAKYLLNQKDKALAENADESTFLKKWQFVLILLVIMLLSFTLFGYQRLKKSKVQLSEKEEENTKINQEIQNQKRAILELKSKAILPVDEIISIESDGHYLEFFLSSKDKPEVDRNRLKEIKAFLPTRFVQIHRSYIINTEFIKVKYADKVLLKDGRELPVSRTYKKELNKAF